VLLQIFGHAVDFCLKFLHFGSFAKSVVEDMEVPFTRIVGEQSGLDRRPVHLVFPHGVFALGLKRAFQRQDQLVDNTRHPLDHHYEVVAVLVHVLDVCLAEIATVEYEADVGVAVAFGLAYHVLQLRHVHDASRIVLVEKRLAVRAVVGDGIVENWQLQVVLCLAELNQPEVARLAILVAGIVGYVDFFLDVPVLVPGGQKIQWLLSRHGGQEVGHLSVAVLSHPGSEQRVVVGVVGIVLRGIVLANDGICGQVQEQPKVARRENFTQHRRKAVAIHDFSDNDICANPDAAAAGCSCRFARQFFVW